MCLKGPFVVEETEFKFSIFYIYNINEVITQTQKYLFSL